ncbi:MAG: trypsin-like peptidase domain-containing protein [Bdellovibrio sp.]
MPHKTKNIVDDARAASKAVVRLHVRGFSELDPRAILDPRFVVPEEWTGSGFFIKINGHDGYIVTNSHVARNSRTLEIKSIVTSDELFKVEVVGFIDDLEPDIALLTFSKGEKERFLSLCSEKTIPSLIPEYEREVKRGEEVKTIGYPLGMSEPNVSGGEISNFIAGTDETAERMVTDAAINPGNSGGPAVIKGPKVVGINTAIIMGAENIGFITPIHLVNNLFDLFMQKKPVGLFKLGASLQKNSDLNAKMLGVKKTEGVIVTKIFKGSPADSMGLQVFDVILQVNNQRLDRHGNIIGEQSIRKRNFYDLIHKIDLDDFFVLKICRQGKIMDLKGRAFLWKNDDIKSHPVISKRRYFYFYGLILQTVSTEIIDSLESIGLERDHILRDFYKSKSEIIVTHIVAGSPAEEMGLFLGDFLVAVEKQKVRTFKNLISLIKNLIKIKKPMAFCEFASGSIAYFNMRVQPQNDLFIHHSESESLTGI